MIQKECFFIAKCSPFVTFVTSFQMLREGTEHIQKCHEKRSRKAICKYNDCDRIKRVKLLTWRDSTVFTKVSNVTCSLESRRRIDTLDWISLEAFFKFTYICVNLVDSPWTSFNWELNTLNWEVSSRCVFSAADSAFSASSKTVHFPSNFKSEGDGLAFRNFLRLWISSSSNFRSFSRGWNRRYDFTWKSCWAKIILNTWQVPH